MRTATKNIGRPVFKGKHIPPTDQHKYHIAWFCKRTQKKGVGRLRYTIKEVHEKCAALQQAFGAKNVYTVQLMEGL